MNCRKAKKRLSACQDGELKPHERQELEDHLKDCRVCSQQYEQMQWVWIALGDWKEIDPTPLFYARVLGRMQERHDRRPLLSLRWVSQPFPAPLATLTVLLVGILVGTYLGNLLVTGDFYPLWSRPTSFARAGVTLASLRAFDPIPPGTLGEGYLRAACDLKDGHR